MRYNLIHPLQPQLLVSYKQGLLGTEDFLAPEIKAVKRNGDKPMEICDSLGSGWGYRENAQHLTATRALAKLRKARAAGANLLLNTGPLPDGSIHQDDIATLREVGKRPVQNS
jgi:alpha-L-fucosidase